MRDRSDATLRERIQRLYDVGATPCLDRESHHQIHAQDAPTVAQLVDVIGDLTLWEVKRLVELATEDHNAACLATTEPAWLRVV